IPGEIYKIPLGGRCCVYRCGGSGAQPDGEYIDGRDAGMRKMFFFQRLSAAHVERIRKEAPDWEIVHGQEPETWTDHLAEAEIWGGWRTEAEELLLSGRAKPRWIHLWTAGA